MKIYWLLPLLLAAAVPLSAQLYTFNPADSLQTYPVGINDSGTITGYYADVVGPVGGASYGFVREPKQGEIIWFDPLGSCCIVVAGINASGAITGTYDPAGLAGGPGFVLDANGDTTTFGAPDSGAGLSPTAINSEGAVVGSYLSAGAVGQSHGFILAPQGNIPTSVDPPDSRGTYAESINSGGAIAGYYATAASEVFHLHGFVRGAKGNFATFDPPGSVATYALSINSGGAIVGFYADASDVDHGFVRDPLGNITSFDPPDSVETIAKSINSSGATVGYYTDVSGLDHGFVRDPLGNITTFNLPDSYATYPASINSSGAITGSYVPGSGAGSIDGFVGRVPNAMDISYYTGVQPGSFFANAMQAGVSNVMVQAWGGLSSNSNANAQVGGAQEAGLYTGVYILLNYYDAAKDMTTGAGAMDQVNQAMTAVAAGSLSALAGVKVIAIDVEPCAQCGEFVSWQSNHPYNKTGTRITDPADHIQEVARAGTSGPGPVTWNDKGGETNDGAGGMGGAVWKDTGLVFDETNTAANVAEIEAAITAANAYTPNHVIIYTSKNGWDQITDSCDSTSCPTLINMPLWSVGTGGFYGGDGVVHCGDGVAGLVPFTPYSAKSWQTQVGHQYDLGVKTPSACPGDIDIFGLTDGATVDLDYFDPTLFQ